MVNDRVEMVTFRFGLCFAIQVFIQSYHIVELDVIVCFLPSAVLKMAEAKEGYYENFR